MAIAKITDGERDAAAVGALADRPQSTARDGHSGLTPTQLKAKFDALPKINTAKINEIIDLINGESAESLAYLLQTPVEYQGDTMTLYEFLAAVQDGSFGDIAMIGERTLSAEIDHAAGDVFDTKMAGVTAEAETLPAGSSATAVYTPATKKFSFGIPQGEKGDTGEGATDLKNIILSGLAPAPGFGDEDGKWIIENTPLDNNGKVHLKKPFVFLHGNAKYYPVRINAQGSGNSARHIVAASMDYDVYLTDGRWGLKMYECTVSSAGVCSGTSIGTKAVQTEGKITIGGSSTSVGTSYTVQRKPLSITENGVTTTYYVADITS